MRFAQYYHLSTGWNNETKDYSGPREPIEMCGSDGVLKLDRRLKLSNQYQVARRHAEQLNANLKLGITGFMIREGESYMSNRPVTHYLKLPVVTPTPTKGEHTDEQTH